MRSQNINKKATQRKSFDRNCSSSACGDPAGAERKKIIFKKVLENILSIFWGVSHLCIICSCSQQNTILTLSLVRAHIVSLSGHAFCTTCDANNVVVELQ